MQFPAQAGHSEARNRTKMFTIVHCFNAHHEQARVPRRSVKLACIPLRRGVDRKRLFESD